MIINKCYLCGSEDKNIIHKGVRGNSDINVLKCKNCGLVYLDCFIDDSERYYKDSNMRKNEPIDINQVRSIAKSDDDRRFIYTKNTIAGKRVLDFGCGAGGYLLNAMESAKTVYGVELEDAMRQELRREGLVVYSDIDEALKELEGKIDVVVMWHVLEHIDDPQTILRKLGRLLSNGGIIIIEVPNADDALITQYDCKAFQDFTFWEAHLYLFNNSTIKKLFDLSGFKVSYITQIQRYPLANHLYWLSYGKPCGQTIWRELVDASLNKEYENKLVEIGKADTIIAQIHL